MKHLPSIGSLEETVLLIVLTLNGEGYGVSIAREYQQQTGREISVPAIHTVLKRLDGKGLVSSELGESSPSRGGRPKRHFSVTPYGIRVLKAWRETRSRLWQSVPLNLLES